MAESSETIEQLERRLSELRAALKRVEERRLEKGDWAELDGFYADAIAELEGLVAEAEAASEADGIEEPPR